ncbi:hypothetical protein PVAP13_6NG035883 [Panicum virgatum]|uniref:Uncharacterized protein n=1 Tax=Panicum virgatum TaxID=38727 RepID=A0A8T0QUC8_PANVG|nr:hypothetical protein PVAP13_6NG035883 [Panicum virgatum]
MRPLPPSPLPPTPRAAAATTAEVAAGHHGPRPRTHDEHPRVGDAAAAAQGRQGPTTCLRARSRRIRPPATTRNRPRAATDAPMVETAAAAPRRPGQGLALPRAAAPRRPGQGLALPRAAAAASGAGWCRRASARPRAGPVGCAPGSGGASVKKASAASGRGRNTTPRAAATFFRIGYRIPRTAGPRKHGTPSPAAAPADAGEQGGGRRRERRPRGAAEGAGQDLGVAEPREGAWAEEPCPAPPRARRGGELSPHRVDQPPGAPDPVPRTPDPQPRDAAAATEPDTRRCSSCAAVLARCTGEAPPPPSPHVHGLPAPRSGGGKVEGEVGRGGARRRGWAPPDCFSEERERCRRLLRRLRKSGGACSYGSRQLQATAAGAEPSRRRPQGSDARARARAENPFWRQIERSAAVPRRRSSSSPPPRKPAPAPPLAGRCRRRRGRAGPPRRRTGSSGCAAARWPWPMPSRPRSSFLPLPRKPPPRCRSSAAADAVPAAVVQQRTQKSSRNLSPLEQRTPWRSNSTGGLPASCHHGQSRPALAIRGHALSTRLAPSAWPVLCRARRTIADPAAATPSPGREPAGRPSPRVIGSPFSRLRPMLARALAGSAPGARGHPGQRRAAASLLLCVVKSRPAPAAQTGEQGGRGSASKADADRRAARQPPPAVRTRPPPRVASSWGGAEFGEFP